VPPTNLLTSSLDKIRDTARGALTDPKGTAGKALGQAKEAVSFGRSMVEGVASRVTARATGRRPPQVAPSTVSKDEAPPPTARAVPAEEPPAPHGDAVAPSATAGRPPVKKAPPVKTVAPVKKSAPAKKAPAKKAPGKKAAVTEPALRGGARDEVVYTTETSGAPAAPGDSSPRPDEESLIDPGTAKQIAKEAERGRRDAEPS
jgi:DNA-binding protein HU-beta